MRLMHVIAAVAVSVSLCGDFAFAQATSAYEPQKGDEVVLYSHRFKAEDFEKGVKLVEDGFTAAQKAAGQTRRNEFLVNPASYEIVVVSYFAPGSSVDDWHQFMGRLEVLKQLEPMRSQPLRLERYTLDATSAVDGNGKH